MRIRSAAPFVVLLLSLPARALYVQTDLVSDLTGAAHQDANLRNPWGLARSPSSPFWVADNGTGVSTLYAADGTPNALVVSVPPAAGAQPPSAPTGVVFNGGTSFELNPGAPARFLFATEVGTVSGWSSGTSAIRKIDLSASDAVYKGLAISVSGSGSFLYAANFHAGTIDVFDSSFGQTSLPGSFTDPTLPSGYAPFNVRNLGGSLYVTYALQDATGKDDAPGAGHGFVDVFDTAGSLQRRLVSGGDLNSPWGLALAPANFGELSNALLVGNFGDGKIHAYDPLTGAPIGTMQDSNGDPIQIDGLWGLEFGGGTANNGDTSALFFTAGIAGPDAIEDHGLFGSLTFVPEPSSLALLASALAPLAWGRRASRRRGPASDDRQSSGARPPG